MKTAMYAVIKKDFRGVAGNRRLFSTLFIVPLVLTIAMPSVFIITMHFVPDGLNVNVEKLLSLLPETARMESLELTVSGMVFNYILPVFFLVIPIMTASIMAASAFVGEKERHTLETLLYCPLTLRQIFQAKVWASFLLSMLVSLISFTAMLLVIETELFFLSGRLLIPSVSWLVVMLLLSPAISLIAVTLIVRESAKAQSVEESQQAAVFLVLPIILLAAGQFTGVLLMSVWILLGLGIVCAILAWIFLQKSMGRFTYERLLQ
ncbi:MAG: ABC transporter permease subunit [Eubacteriales bacterium]|nr:ABC transporter permease subunit [Eubacteriales bacterium]